MGWETLSWRRGETLPRVISPSVSVAIIFFVLFQISIHTIPIRNAVSDIDNGKSIRATALEYGIDRNEIYKRQDQIVKNK